MALGHLPRRAKSDPEFYDARPLELLPRTALPNFQSSDSIPLDTVLSDGATIAAFQSSGSISVIPSAEPSGWLSKSSFPPNGSTICTSAAVPSDLWSSLYPNPHPTGLVDTPLPNSQLKDALARRPTFLSPESQSSIGHSRAANGSNTSASGSANLPLSSLELRDPIGRRPPSVSPESQARRDSKSTNRYNTSGSRLVNNPFHGTTSTALPTDHQLFPQTSQPSTNSTVWAYTSASASVPRENPVVNVEFQALVGELDDSSDNLEVRFDYFESGGDRTESPTNLMPPSPPEPISSARTDDTISADSSDDTIILNSDRYYRQYLADARRSLFSSRAELARNREYKPPPQSALAYVDEEVVNAASRTDLPKKDEMEEMRASGQEKNL